MVKNVIFTSLSGRKKLAHFTIVRQYRLIFTLFMIGWKYVGDTKTWISG